MFSNLLVTQWLLNGYLLVTQFPSSWEEGCPQGGVVESPLHYFLNFFICACAECIISIIGYQRASAGAKLPSSPHRLQARVKVYHFPLQYPRGRCLRLVSNCPKFPPCQISPSNHSPVFKSLSE